MNRPPKRKRRDFFVKHESHGRLIFRLGVILLVFVVISGATFYLMAQQELSNEFYKAHSQIRNTMEMLLPWLIIVFALGIGAAIFLTAGYTRRIAGPVLRFSRELEKLTQGDMTSRIQLRKRDEFQGLANKVNGLSESVANRFQRLDAVENRLRVIADQLQSTNCTTDEHNKAIAELDRTASEMKSILSDIRW